MTHQRKPLHQSQRRLRGGGDEDEVVDVEDGKRMNFIPQSQCATGRLSTVSVLGGDFRRRYEDGTNQYSRVGGHKISRARFKPSTRIELILND